MKKIISVLLVVAIMLSFCACGKTGKTNTDAAETGNSAGKTAEELYGHIDQLTLIDGVYKIWSEVGVQNMADHPDADFELLCNIDLQGAVLRPLGSTATPFTGKIKGGNFILSNFTVQGESDESFGFVAINEGTVRELVLENVTLIPNKEAKNIGAFAGVNNGKVTMCSIKSGAMSVEAAAADAACGAAVGKNTAELSSTDVTVDLSFTAPVSAAVGGLVGITEGGIVEYSNTYGKLDITGEDKAVGLLAGKADNVKLTECAFVGATNALNGKLFDQYFGAGENTEAVKCLRRDNHVEPLTEGQAALRDRVVEEMRAMGTLEWKVREELTHTCTCSYSGCYTTYAPKYTYVGLPYNHYSSPPEKAMYFIDNEGYVKDWAYSMDAAGGYDLYIGSDCSASVQLAWWTVSNHAQFFRTGGMLPSLGLGCLPVGDYEWDFYLEGAGTYTTEYTNKITIATGEQRMYEAYGQMRRGDAIMYQIEAGGHARMASADAVVVRDDEGNINPEYSYVLMHEQGAGFTDEETAYKTSWRIDYKYTFANLYYDGAIPVTCEELMTGQMDPVTCELNNSADGYAGMFSGTVESNYQINAVTLKITDHEGNVAFEMPYFPSAEKGVDYGTYHHKARGLNLSVDLASFATLLQDTQFVGGEEYSYEIVASIATGDKYELKTGTFTLGSAQ